MPCDVRKVKLRLFSMTIRTKIYFAGMLILLAVLLVSGFRSFQGTTLLQANASSSPSKGTLEKLLPDTIGSGKPVILDFYTPFCLACQRIKPKLEKVSTEPPSVTLMRINLQNPDSTTQGLSKAFGIGTAPYVVFISGKGIAKSTFLEDTDIAELRKAKQEILKK
jgi:thioredoxin 1